MGKRGRGRGRGPGGAPAGALAAGALAAALVGGGAGWDAVPMGVSRVVYQGRSSPDAPPGESWPSARGEGAGLTACALGPGGALKCWGSNINGALGYGDDMDRGWREDTMHGNLPDVDLGGGRTARDVSAAHGGSHVCALLDNGEVKCWGIGQSGELGCGDAYHRSAPPASVDLGTGRTARAVAAGANHTCAILDNGRVKCWGSRKLGVLGSGSSVSLSCGHDKDDMGDNLPYTNLGAGRTAKSIVAGETHTCAILDNDRVKCWGKYAATGHGDLKTRGEVSSQMGDSLPYVDLGNQGDTVVQLSAEGAFHVCAILANGWREGHVRRNVKCWGRNAHGQLGYGDTKDRGGGRTKWATTCLSWTWVVIAPNQCTQASTARVLS